VAEGLEVGSDHRGFTAPLRVYEEAIAPSGATFLRGQSAWRGDYVFAALRGEALHRLRFEGHRVVQDEVPLDGLRTVRPGPDGALYVLTGNRDGRGSPADGDDRILRLSAP
jgi:aldose sugar dehydrogenase